MNYCSIDSETREHLLKLIEWIYEEIKSSGGDGDCLWFSKYYNTKDILVLIKEFNSKLKHPWEVIFEEVIFDHKSTIHWGQDQQWATITNDEEIYKNAPVWQQCKIVL